MEFEELNGSSFRNRRWNDYNQSIDKVLKCVWPSKFGSFIIHLKSGVKRLVSAALTSV